MKTNETLFKELIDEVGNTGCAILKVALMEKIEEILKDKEKVKRENANGFINPEYIIYVLETAMAKFQEPNTTSFLDPNIVPNTLPVEDIPIEDFIDESPYPYGPHEGCEEFEGGLG